MREHEFFLWKQKYLKSLLGLETPKLSFFSGLTHNAPVAFDFTKKKIESNTNYYYNSTHEKKYIFKFLLSDTKILVTPITRSTVLLYLKLYGYVCPRFIQCVSKGNGYVFSRHNHQI